MITAEVKQALTHTSYQDFEDGKRVQFIYDHIKHLKNAEGRILDIGCGIGNISKAMGALGFRVLGLDVDFESVELAKKTNTVGSNVEFQWEDAENLVEKTEKFEAIICSEVLEHLHDPASLVKQFTPWLKPNGILIVTVPNGKGPREMTVTRPVQLIMRTPLKHLLLAVKKGLGYKNATLHSNNPDLSHIQYFSFKQICRLVKNEGYEFLAGGKSNFVEKVFPFSLYYKHQPERQEKDCNTADRLPYWMASGFLTAWRKK